MGGVLVHIKALKLHQIPHQRKVLTEDVGNHYTFRMLGSTLRWASAELHYVP